jgi:hypothetical protein
MCKITTSPDDEPTERCDGCDATFPESELTACEARYVDETTETFKFCPDCLKADLAYETPYPEYY